jgi:spore coat protein U-like protein
MMNRILKLLACGAILAAGSAFAQSATGTFTVTATVAKTCTVSASSVTLPPYDSTAGTVSEGTTTVNVACTRRTPYTVALASTGNRWQLSPASGADRLNYEIYSDSSHDTRWNERTSVAGTGAGHVPNQHVAYIRVPASQDAAEGSYSDTVTMTVSY